MTPKSEIALTALVVIALLAGAAIVSISALAKQARYGTPGVAMPVTSP
jgi:DNA-binding IscR family transcriptional regulator